MIFTSGNRPDCVEANQMEQIYPNIAGFWESTVVIELRSGSLVQTLSSMATLWSEISAVLPLSEEEFPLQFSDKVESSVVEMLRRSRQLLYREASGTSRMLQAQIILDYSWEKLNTGTWRHVDKDWRRVYSYGCLFKVAALCRRDPSADDVLQAVRTCDMALLMGAAIMGDILQVIVQILQREVSKPTDEEDEAERSEVKVGGLLNALVLSQRFYSFNVYVLIEICARAFVKAVVFLSKTGCGDLPGQHAEC